MTDIVARLLAATLDKDNFPRMDSERAVPVGLAKEAAADIERLRTAPWVFRCSCQIADNVAPECSARGWCKERKP